MFMQRFLLLFIGVVLLSLTAVAQNENALYEKGYYGNIELDMGSTFGFSADVPDRGLNAGVLTSHGYSSGSGLYVGAGAGLIFNTEHYSFVSVPVFADVKYSFLDNDFSPFMSCKIGTVINDEFGAGVYCAPSAGVDMKRFSVFLKYDLGTGRTSWYSNMKLIEVEYTKHAFSAGVSYAF